MSDQSSDGQSPIIDRSLIINEHEQINKKKPRLQKTSNSGTTLIIVVFSLQK